MTAITIDLNSVVTLSHEQFIQLCRSNPDIRFELTAQGHLVLLSYLDGETGHLLSTLNGQLGLWNHQHQLGVCFSSSTGFVLANGAIRSPNLSWLKKSRWQNLSSKQRESFVPLCPDFVVELISPSDVVQQTRAKMQEYFTNGCRLGWLINRGDRQVEVYRMGQAVEISEAPMCLSGENVLPDFELDLAEFWQQ